MYQYTCQKKRVAMCMFLANLFKHLRAESEEASAKLKLAGLSGKFESNPQLSKKGWKYVQGILAHQFTTFSHISSWNMGKEALTVVSRFKTFGRCTC